MKDCLKYLIILFVLSVFLSKMVEDKEDNVEGLVNLLNDAQELKLWRNLSFQQLHILETYFQNVILNQYLYLACS